MGVQITSIPSPAFYGLAKDREEFPLGPEWAVEALNLVIDATGRISARNGWVQQNESEFASGDDTLQIFQYVKADGTTEDIYSTESDIFRAFGTPSSIVGSLTPDDGNWQFINFNGFCLGWQAGETPIVYSGTTFADITAATGTLPDGNAACAAFGRVWAVDDDGQTIRYCALLDHTKWDVADGGGLIDMRTVWSQGMDTVQAIAAMGSNLIVFGKRHIIVWADGTGSQLGLNPLNMYVTDTIDHVGLVSRDAMALVGEVDVVFWSQSGIRSLVRTMQERASPISDMSPNNRNYIRAAFTEATVGSIRATYAAKLGLVLFTSPVLERLLVFDVRQQTPDNGFRLTEWEITPHPTTVFAKLNGNLMFGFAGFTGLYDGYDDDDVAYPFQYESGWVDVKGENARKQALKALKAFIYTEQEQSVQISWGPDFAGLGQSVVRSVGAGSGASEYAVAEFGIGEFGPAGKVSSIRVPLTKEAEFLKLKVSTSVNSKAFALQPLTIYTKPLRAA